MLVTSDIPLLFVETGYFYHSIFCVADDQLTSDEPPGFPAMAEQAFWLETGILSLNVARTSKQA